jgi:hypothetical protein
MHIAAYKAVGSYNSRCEKRDTLHAKATEFKNVKNRSYPPYGYTTYRSRTGYVAQLNYGLKAVKIH